MRYNLILEFFLLADAISTLKSQITKGLNNHRTTTRPHHTTRKTLNKKNLTSRSQL